MKTVITHTSRILVGGIDEANALSESYLSKMVEQRQETRFVENTKIILDNENLSHETRRVLNTLVAQSLHQNIIEKHQMLHNGSKRIIRKGKGDFKKLKNNHRIIVIHKGNPRGKSFVSDDAIKNTLRVIVQSCSSTAWSIRCHIIRPEKVLRSKREILCMTMRIII